MTFVDQNTQEEVYWSITPREIMRKVSIILVMFVLKGFIKGQNIKNLSTDTQGSRDILVLNVEKVFHTLAILTDM